jgi:hypothetical protein
MKTYLKCLQEAAVILKSPNLAKYLKMTLSKKSVELLEKAADIYASQSNSHKPVVVRGGASETKNVHRHKNDLKWDDFLDTPNTPTEPLPAEGSTKSVRVDLSKMQDLDEDVKQALNNGGLWDMI